MSENPLVNILNRLDVMFQSIGISEDTTHEEALGTLVTMYQHAKAERDEAFHAAASAREEAKRKDDLLVEYHDALASLVRRARGTFEDGCFTDADAVPRANALLARWPEVREEGKG
jgi:hypothetical protein